MSQMPPQGLPPQLAALLGGAGTTSTAPDGDDSNDPLSSLQDAIHGVTRCMVALTDPQDTQDAIKALHILSGVQTRLMKAAPGGNQPQG